MSQSNYQNLINKLDQFIRKYYVNQLIKGAIYFFSILLITYLFVATLEYFGQFSAQVRTGMFYSFTFIIVVIFAKYLLFPISKLLSIGQKLSHKQAAKIIGNHFSEVQDKLYNVLQLKQNDGPTSNDLLAASIDQKIGEIKPVPFSVAINFGENKKYIKYLLAPVCVILFIIFFSPSVLLESTNRLVAHQQDFVPEAPFEFIVVNKELSVFKNEDFTLQLKLRGEEFPNQVFIQLGEQSFLMNKNKSNEFSFTLKNVQSDRVFYFNGNEFYSKNFEIKAIPKPSLTEFRAELLFPKYLGMANKTLVNTGDITIPAGTEIKWTFNTVDTENLQLIFPDSSISVIQKGENEFFYDQYFYQSQSYKLSTSNSFVPLGDTVSYFIEVTPDLRPSIELDTKPDSTDIHTLYFNGDVKDDYGFSRLVFFSQLVKEDGKRGEPIIQEIPINKSLPQTDFFHVWNMSRYGLQSGDRIDYYFEIWDNDGVNGSKSARTQKLEFKAPTKNELSEKEKESNEDIKEELKESIDLAKEIRDDLEALKQKMIDKKTVGFQEKKMLEKLLEKQKKVQNSIKKIKQENEQKNKLQKEFSKQDEQLIEKQKMLEELFEKVMSEEMKEMLAEIEKMMEELKKDELEKALENMELSNEELEKELDRNLELFKQLELEKQLADAKEKLDELKEKQKDLKEKSEDKKSNTEEAQKEQEKLNEEFDELEKELEEIKKKNEELEEPNKMEDTDSLEEQIKEDMKDSAEKLDKKNKKDASESQESAEEKIEELSDKLNDMQMQMQSQANAENMEDLRFLLENLMHLSFDQEKVMQDLKALDRNDPKYVELSQIQKKLKDDAKIIEDSLFALSKRVIQLQFIVNKEINSINYNMDKAMDYLGERQTSQANNRQQLSMTSINNLALILDQALQDMQNQMQMQGSGKCSKPGNGKPKPSPGSMKKMQEALNKQMEALKKKMQNGEKPGGEKGKKPGEGKPGGMGGMSKELAQMAAKQAAIRQALQQMQEQLEGEGNGGGGQLKKLGELMEQTETDIVNKRISNETILRQQEILTRLLESEKAEKEREKEEKRESKEFTEEFVRNQNNFLEYNKRKEKEIELLRTLPPSFNNFYKRKVSEYFNNIEQ